MSGLVGTYLEEQLEILSEWDETDLVDTLRISSQELLDVPEYRKRAIKWIIENCP